MCISLDAEQKLYNLGDSAELTAYVYDAADNLIPQTSLLSVSFKVQLPDKTTQTGVGMIQGDGQGYFRFTATTQVGNHVALAIFTLDTGQIKSVRLDFQVIDPFNPPIPTATQVIGAMVWDKLEDCFDAEDEGPWLRDMTRNHFDRQKMADFIDAALFDINQWNPPTTLDVNYFVTSGVPNVNTPLLAQATFLEVVLHLIRSYTEQPALANGQVAYDDRRDYVMRWQQVFQGEYTKYNRWVVLWKRQFLGLGHAKGIISTKAGRLLASPLRTWAVGRGYH